MHVLSLEPINEQAVWWRGMRLVTRKYSKRKIDRAGEYLIHLEKDDPARQEAIIVVDNWRACHEYPLNTIYMTLLNRARSIEKHALVSQRKKRRPSIELKLRQEPTMKLSQMQDIGGCRAVLNTMENTHKLIAKYKEAHAKSPKNRSYWDGSENSNYIKKPKLDGYRSMHFIFRYLSTSKELRAFNGQRIEIQIRSKLQHLWATAVETAQIFTGKALKSKIKTASEDWQRFFVLASSVFAHKEKTSLIPGTPKNMRNIFRELREIDKREGILEDLRGWNDTIQLVKDKVVPKAEAYLLELNSAERTLRIGAFNRKEKDEAMKMYEAREKETEGDPNIQVVLVNVENVQALPKAYPNFYVHTLDFIKVIERELNQL